MRNPPKRRPSDTNHPAFARYQKMLTGLEALERGPRGTAHGAGEKEAHLLVGE
jgi:hypothetical protein